MSYHAKRYFPPRYFAKRYWSTGEAVPGQVALTGLRVTLAQGALAPEIAGDVSIALVGQAATTAQGLAGVDVLRDLTGGQVTLAAGVLGYSTDNSSTISLSGLGATATGGLSAADISLALTGQVGVGAAGALVAGKAVDLTGQAATGLGGALGVEEEVGLLGQAAAAAGGAATPFVPDNFFIPLLGLRLTTARGYFNFFATTEYDLYARTEPVALAVRVDAAVLFAVRPVEIEPVQVEDDDAAVRTPLVEVQAEVDSVEAWALRSPVDLVAFTEPVVIFAVTVPDAPTATTDTPESTVQTPPVELLAA